MPGLDGLELIRRIRSSAPAQLRLRHPADGQVAARGHRPGDGGRRRRLRDQALRSRRAAGPPAGRRADHPARAEPGRPQRPSCRRSTPGCRSANERMRRDLDAAARVQRALLPTALPEVRRGPLRLGLQAVRGAGRRHPQRRPARRPPRRPLRPRRLRPRRRLGPAVGDGQPLPVAGARLLVAAPEEGRGDVRLHPRAGRRGRRAVESTLPVRTPRPSNISRWSTASSTWRASSSGTSRRGIPPWSTSRPTPPRRSSRRPGSPSASRSPTTRSTCVRLKPGDRLYLYSDGIIEAKDDRQASSSARAAWPISSTRGEPPPSGGPSPTCWGPSSGGPAPTGSHDDVSILAVEVEAPRDAEA